MDSSVRAICHARFVERTGEQPSDLDVESEAVKYFQELADLALQVPLVVNVPAAIEASAPEVVPEPEPEDSVKTIVRKNRKSWQMPTYPYVCPKCECKFSEVRGIKSYSNDSSAICPSCDHKCGSDDREFEGMRTQFIGTKVTSPEYNPGLGCVVKNKFHKEDLMKSKGVFEVGNDFGTGEKQQKHFETRKAEEIEANWKKDDTGIV